MKMIFLMLISNLLLATNVFAHGEEKYGPAGGFIRMPGSFHTEIVPEKDGTFLVFLYDLQNKNPMVNDSAVDFRVKGSKSESPFKCKRMEDHFMCSSDKNVVINVESRIVLRAKRLGIQAKEVIYELPLTLKKGN